MNSDWYYADAGKTVGPVSTSEILARAQTHNPLMVWHAGMTGWEPAASLAAFADALQPDGTPRKERDPEATASAREKLIERARHEITQYLAITAYLCICFGVLIFYKRAILRGVGVEIVPYGLAIIKALILAKFILVLHGLKLGERRVTESTLINRILTKALIFTGTLIVLSIVEEVVVGYFHGRAMSEILGEMAGGTLAEAFATGILMFMIMIPYFAFREVRPDLLETNGGPQSVSGG